MEIMEAIKFFTFYVLQIVVTAFVGVTLLAGLYQVIRDQVHAVKSKQRASRARTPTAVHEPAKRF